MYAGSELHRLRGLSIDVWVDAKQARCLVFEVTLSFWQCLCEGLLRHGERTTAGGDVGGFGPCYPVGLEDTKRRQIDISMLAEELGDIIAGTIKGYGE